ncbi:uncharacterized protein [Aristolochia californica]|uniref:uncharacterized protein n=1 Tax=Aristolochia californica TaxID=171875 RepID=UPI0035E0CC8F
MLGINLQCLFDLFIAGISLMIGFGIFAFAASVLCSAAFLNIAKGVSISERQKGEVAKEKTS